MNQSHRRLLVSLLVAMGLNSGLASAAPPYPNQTVKIVVPFPPGGPADMVARVFADEVQRTTHQTVLVENRTGASGTLGAATVAKAAPDGYTLLVTSASTQSVAPATMKTRPYDPVKDFTPVAQLADTPFLMIVNPAIAAGTLSDFVKELRAKPTAYNHGVSGVGSLVHLAGLRFEALTGTRVTPVQYRGGQPVLIDVASGQLQFAFMDAGSAAPFIKSGRVKALAVAAPRRLATLPDVPTFSEAGVNGFEIPGWIGLFAPAGTPKTVTDVLAQLAAATTREGASRQRIASIGLEPAFDDEPGLRRKVEGDFRRAAELVRAAKIEIE